MTVVLDLGLEMGSWNKLMLDYVSIGGGWSVAVMVMVVLLAVDCWIIPQICWLRHKKPGHVLLVLGKDAATVLLATFGGWTIGSPFFFFLFFGGCSFQSNAVVPLHAIVN